MKGQLVNAEEVKHAWTNYIAAFRARLLAMPSKISGEGAGVDSIPVGQKIIK